jgi:cytochrome c-type biogenesis protein CcmH
VRKTLQAAALVLLFALCCGGWLIPAASRAEAGSTSRRADRASEIEQRLFAPCCWTQTLDVHDSALSSELRLDIRARLTRGESARTIEDALAARFGERIRAVPRDGDARVLAPMVVGALMALSLLSLFAVIRRGQRRGQTGPLSQPPTHSLDDGYDAALDRELERR